ncbi:MAG: spore coat U domain-containing protein, partial [Alphaproteobacteria bacterium]|nr:spore coat U domain-containing protein [Alphaproteobacteria bacterium]
MRSMAGGVVFSGASPGCGSVARTAAFTFNVTATVMPACTVSASNLTFNLTSVLAANNDAASAISVTCTNGTPYHARLDGGSTGATNPALRKMSNGPN